MFVFQYLVELVVDFTILNTHRLPCICVEYKKRRKTRRRKNRIALIFLSFIHIHKHTRRNPLKKMTATKRGDIDKKKKLKQKPSGS